MRRVRALGLAALFGLLAGSALAQDFDRFGGIDVDVRPLAAYAQGPQAQALRADLTAALQRAFGDRIARGGPRLVVRVSGLSINPYAGSQGSGRGGLGGGGTTDYLEGEALLVGRDGTILARHPQLSALPASSGGAWYDPASERRRVAALAEHYAAWLQRSLPAR